MIFVVISGAITILANQSSILPFSKPAQTSIEINQTLQPIQKTNQRSSAMVLPTDSVTTLAWVYPGEPSCNAKKEYSDGRNIDVLRAEYMTIDDYGMIQILSEEEAGCNGYSPQNLSDLKKYSTYQLATISGIGTGLMELLNDKSKQQKAIEAATNFVITTEMNGVDIDFEDFGNWNETQYSAYKSMMTELGTQLHSHGKSLVINGPAIYDSAIQNAFQWRYTDFDKLPIDYITVMAYDYQYDYGGGTPVAPDEFITASIEDAKKGITDHSRIIVGIPSYGYSAKEGSYKGIKITTFEQDANTFGLNNATRDSSSQEMIRTINGEVSVFQDEISLDHKKRLVLNSGLNKISVWHLGGNRWFSK